MEPLFGIVVLMIYVVLAVFGAVAGSFVNALVWRLHELSVKKKLSAGRKRELSMMRGRSMCSQCGHQLSWQDLIPVLSWVSLRGKCRYCHKPIADSPLVEVGLGVSFAISYLFWPVALQGSGLVDFAVWLILLVGLAALLVYDLRWMLLPNKIVYPLLWIAGASLAVQVVLYSGGARLLMDGLCGFLVGGGIFYVLFQVSSGKWIGGGDVRLGALLGLILASPAKALLLIFVASSLGTLYVLPPLLTRKLKTNMRIPFGPFLIIAAVVVKLAGSAILQWYNRTFLIV